MADNEDNLDALCDMLEDSDDEDIFNLVDEQVNETEQNENPTEQKKVRKAEAIFKVHAENVDRRSTIHSCRAQCQNKCNYALKSYFRFP